MLKLNRYTLMAVLHDLLMAALAWIAAYLLRFNFDIPPNYQSDMWRTLVLIMPFQWAIFWYMDLYRGIWRYASLADVRRIGFALMLEAILIPIVLWMFINARTPHGFDFGPGFMNRF